jgi:hypothetical protein
MSPGERDLNEALRMLAQSGPGGAPPAMESRLQAAFRHRVRVRRVRNGLIWAGAAAAVALGVLSIPPSPQRLDLQVAHIAPPATAITAASRPPVPRRVAAKRRVPPAVQTAGFYAVPGADTLAPIEYATVVRVSMPRSALRMIGFRVNEERAAEPIQADVLLGQDGLARALRLVQ